MKALVELANIPRSTYYDLVKKMNRPDLDADLKAEIKAIYEENTVMATVAFVMS